MKTIKKISSGVFILAAAGLMLSSCFSAFDPTGYAPKFTINGYTAADEVGGSGSLVAHWAFENNYVDGVSNTVGTPNHESSVSFTPGFKGQAVQVVSPGYIDTNVGSTIAGLGSFSFCSWISQPANLSGATFTYLPYSLNQPGYSWEESKFFLLLDNPGSSTTNSYGKVVLMDQWFDKGATWPLLLDGHWHHLAVTFDGTSGAFRIYIDGTLLTSSSSFSYNPQENFGAAANFTLGGPDDNTHSANGWMNSLNGAMDEMRVYNIVLSPSDIASLIVLEGKGK